MKVVIVGAGLGGIACGIACRRQGLDVTIFERAPELSEACDPSDSTLSFKHKTDRRHRLGQAFKFRLMHVACWIISVSLKRSNAKQLRFLPATSVAGIMAISWLHANTALSRMPSMDIQPCESLSYLNVFGMIC